MSGVLVWSLFQRGIGISSVVWLGCFSHVARERDLRWDMSFTLNIICEVWGRAKLGGCFDSRQKGM